MNFGKKFKSEKILTEFKNFCEDRNYSYSEMKEEMKRSEKAIKEESTYAYSSIQECVYNHDTCPLCSNDLLRNQLEEEKYCPSCYDK